jgi:hypothetical protein
MIFNISNNGIVTKLNIQAAAPGIKLIVSPAAPGIKFIMGGPVIMTNTGASANNGASINAGIVQVGQPVGAATDPGKLLHDTDIVMNGKVWRFLGSAQMLRFIEDGTKFYLSFGPFLMSPQFWFDSVTGRITFPTDIEVDRVFLPGGSLLLDRLNEENYNQSLLGVQDGFNATFTTANNFVPGSERIYLNGLKQKIINDYQTSGFNTVIFNVPPAPVEVILIDYKQKF